MRGSFLFRSNFLFPHSPKYRSGTMYQRAENNVIGWMFSKLNTIIILQPLFEITTWAGIDNLRHSAIEFVASNFHVSGFPRWQHPYCPRFHPKTTPDLSSRATGRRRSLATELFREFLYFPQTTLRRAFGGNFLFNERHFLSRSPKRENHDTAVFLA